MPLDYNKTTIEGVMPSIRGCKDGRSKLNKGAYCCKDLNVYPKLSIIIPHHNIPFMLERCIDSIPIRSDIQIIVVDDASDENICKFEDLPGRQYIDVEFYRTKRCLGGGAARNIGMKYARGEWVTFLDADDMFTPKADEIISDLYNISQSIDIIFCSANSIDNEFFSSADRANTLNRYINLYDKDSNESEMRLRYTFGEPWCKIVRRSLIESNKICFSETSIHNDTKYSYLVGFYAKDICIDKRALCTITQRSGSVSRVLCESKKLERIEVFGEAERFFLNHNIPKRYIIRFLWPQMARSFINNRQTFFTGYRILKSKNFSSVYIYFNTFKYIIRNFLVKYAKQIVYRLNKL